MTDQNLDLEGTATANEAPDVATQAEAQTTAATPEAKQEGSLTVNDAVLKAYQQHAEKSQDAPVSSKAASAALAPATAEPEKAVDPITGRTIEPIKAPNSWTPTLREKWGSIDPVVQKFLIDRERDMSNKLNETADERKLAGSFKEVAAPYEAMLRQFNTNAVDHAKELFTLSHTLNTGSPQVKAQVIYNLISHFRPDPQTLQQLFAGQPVQHTTSNAPQPLDVASEVEKALAARAEQEQAAQAKREIDAFSADPKNEFFSDVRDLMGKIIDAGLVTGNSMTELFSNAYNLACNQHPEIGPILAQRSQASQVPQVSLPSAQQAKPISSVKPSLGSGRTAKAQPKSMSMDAAIKAAMEKHGVQL